MDSLYTPSPNRYAPKNNKASSPQIKIGTAPRNIQQPNNFPGPGSYKLEYKETHGPKYTMRAKNQSNLEKLNCSPGPSAYSPYRVKDNNFKYSMSFKHDQKQFESTPGPGSYKIRDDKSLERPGYKFGKEKRLDISVGDASSPGPASYHSKAYLMYRTLPKYSFGKDKRRALNDSEITPGPGEYKFKSFIGKEGPKLTMRQKLSKSQSAVNLCPGPGQYKDANADLYLYRSPSYKIGTSEREPRRVNLPNVGPGQYNINKKLTHSPSCIIGTSQRKPLSSTDQSIPGVGAYNLRKNSNNAPKYSLVGSKDTKLAKSNFPGPGSYSYSMTNFKHYPSWKIGTSPREDEVSKASKEHFPGPADYFGKNQFVSNGAKYGFGTGKRETEKYSDAPGPGSYHIPCSIVEISEYTRNSGKFDPKFKFI